MSSEPPSYSDGASGEPNEIVEAIIDLGKQSKFISSSFDSLIIKTAGVETGEFQKDLQSCRTLYKDLAQAAVFVALDAKLAALDKFIQYTTHARTQSTENTIKALNFLVKKFPTNVQIVHSDFTFADFEDKVKALTAVLERKVKETEQNVDKAVLEAEAVVAEADANVAAAKEAANNSLVTLVKSAVGQGPKLWVLVNLGPSAVFSFFKDAIKNAVSDIPDTIAQVKEKIFNPQGKITGGLISLGKRTAAQDKQNQARLVHKLVDKDQALRREALDMLRTLTTDFHNIVPKLEVFASLYDLVKKDSEDYLALLSSPDIKVEAKKEECMKRIAASIQLFGALADGIAKFAA
ncbi:hypothetical protein B0H17DRAFT_1201784 [Mycena rosella]|uniref:Uncharacterized protein n=1 Tax=Mycena rosella TaxID=1033263 RepID=A0AAD7DFJ6_MYCRO|nr:hypothetical protein B0H17DRAFT_1201784 [Mycena rosella]